VHERISLVRSTSVRRVRWSIVQGIGHIPLGWRVERRFEQDPLDDFP